ncbi:leucine-rich repeat flightless-interacting protein 2 isoform X1 [Temnothorax curvispinosus]|uniref:Leucine-rich repeat flightless-interacting protein 2 isoform X1 n=1 Tax=Temnothorax curvispinosus TaxID=300111 RepID=A0A6J1Q7Y5_9HYME|nr:leucine-rich repeat flightless-interacting protein 2 isoform X1 [Temnothorax curvispinosus]XP_024876990.1 leucine-rich repeat flightless-interacting protein 2 isoform X1 [Temnothorax curvispinosus]XP_024876991.1 leucine-rich repeat flightless-interacting protein 2 isoform X1 [Temnothorax curvispinosus]
MESAIAGRRRTATRHSAEDQALDQIAKEAEARLAARRQARAEAREIRMRELERQQKEAEENADRVYDMCAGSFKEINRILSFMLYTSICFQ